MIIIILIILPIDIGDDGVENDINHNGADNGYKGEGHNDHGNNNNDDRNCYALSPWGRIYKCIPWVWEAARRCLLPAILGPQSKSLSVWGRKQLRNSPVGFKEDSYAQLSLGRGNTLPSARRPYPLLYFLLTSNSETVVVPAPGRPKAQETNEHSQPHQGKARDSATPPSHHTVYNVPARIPIHYKMSP